jgi:4-amino-4-deoxy-L-arabinose transferase-like glycosyltransferase
MKRNIVILLFFSITLRFIVEILNFYYFPNFLPHSGADSVVFEKTGFELANGNLDISTYSWDNYPLFIYLVYSIIGREPFVIMGLNGVFSIFASYFLYKSIIILTSDAKKAFYGMFIFLLFPHAIIFSSVILRESLIVFFVTFSIFMFVKFTQLKKIKQFILAFALLFMASLLHAGVIFLSIVYLCYFLMQKSYSNKLDIIKKPVIFIILAIILIGVFAYDDLFLRKFTGFDSVETFVERVERGTDNPGGSAYLQGYDVNSLKDIFTYAPLKLVYFFFSPLPWDIRNMNDIIAIMLDVVIYYYLFMQLVLKMKKLKWKDPSNKLFISLLIGIFITGLVFALGTSNAGTALRHRYKILTLILLALYIPIKSKIKKTTADKKKFT